MDGIITGYKTKRSNNSSIPLINGVTSPTSMKNFEYFEGHSSSSFTADLHVTCMFIFRICAKLLHQYKSINNRNTEIVNHILEKEWNYKLENEESSM